MEANNHVKYRCYEFSVAIVDLLEKLPHNYIYQTLGKQLLRAATSVGANVVEAQAGSSRKDFINYYHIALKSCNETRYWLAIILKKQSDVSLKNYINNLIKESTEIGRILGASLVTLKNVKK